MKKDSGTFLATVEWYENFILKPAGQGPFLVGNTKEKKNPKVPPEQRKL